MTVVNIGIPIKALPAWRSLQSALTQATDRGDTIPCQQADPVLWEGDDPELSRYAISQCKRCPVLAACANYAVAASERNGIWGGKDRTKRLGRPPALFEIEATR